VLIKYKSIDGYVRDGIRLSVGMGRKSALAGLWWGGGKGVIAHGSSWDYTNKSQRKVHQHGLCDLVLIEIAVHAGYGTYQALMEDYGAFLTSLRGCYVAAEDSGVSVEDVRCSILSPGCLSHARTGRRSIQQE
jgi:leucine dehydrogenase